MSAAAAKLGGLGISKHDRASSDGYDFASPPTSTWKCFGVASFISRALGRARAGDRRGRGVQAAKRAAQEAIDDLPQLARQGDIRFRLRRGIFTLQGLEVSRDLVKHL